MKKIDIEYGISEVRLSRIVWNLSRVGIVYPYLSQEFEPVPEGTYEYLERRIRLRAESGFEPEFAWDWINLHAGKLDERGEVTAEYALAAEVMES